MEFLYAIFKLNINIDGEEMKINKKLIAVIIAILLLVIALLYNNHLKVIKLNEYKKNIVEIEKLGNKNIAEVEEKIKQGRLKNNIKPVTVSNRIAFDDAVFIGDSLTEPLANYEFLSQSNVLAKVGMNLKTAESLINNIENLNPSNVFLLFGLNDIIATNTTEEFIQNYDLFINKVRSKVPNAKIYIISVLPVKDFVEQKSPKLNSGNILLYNNALMKFAEDKKYKFIDLRKIAIENPALYEPDGEHFKKPFYNIFLDEIKTILAQEKEE